MNKWSSYVDTRAHELKRKYLKSGQLTSQTFNQVIDLIGMLNMLIENSSDTPEQIRDKLQTLIGDNRLDASAIKNLELLWTFNTKYQHGYVEAGGDNFNKAWATDASGNPGWRDVGPISQPETVSTIARHTQTIPAITWTFNHNLNELYPVMTVYNSDREVIVPEIIHAIDINTAEITFAYPTTGTAIAIASGERMIEPGTGLTAIEIRDLLQTLFADDRLDAAFIKNIELLGDLNYIHTQTVPSTIWLITHNLNKYPSVTVIDSGNNVVEGGIEYLDSNTVRLTFSAGFSGKAYLN